MAAFGYIACGLNLVALFLTIWFYPIDFSKYQKEPSKTDIEAVKDTELEDKPRLTGEPVQTLSETEKPSLNMAEKRKTFEESEFEKMHGRVSIVL